MNKGITQAQLDKLKATFEEWRLLKARFEMLEAFQIQMLHAADCFFKRKNILLLVLGLFFMSCALPLKGRYEKDFRYRYIELPDTLTVKEGFSDELYLPGDTIVEYPTNRTFVVVAVRMKGDSTWIFYKKPLKPKF